MLPQISGSIASSDRSLCCFLIACSLIVAIISMLVGIKVSAATAWSGVAASKQTINSARKGDRLPLVVVSDPTPANGRIEVNLPRRAVQHSLPDGCEALASPLARSTAAQIAGRCMS
jgi:hypothetical protein